MKATDFIYAVIMGLCGIGGYAGLCLASYYEDEWREFLHKKYEKIKQRHKNKKHKNKLFREKSGKTRR